MKQTQETGKNKGKKAESNRKNTVLSSLGFLIEARFGQKDNYLKVMEGVDKNKQTKTQKLVLSSKRPKKEQTGNTETLGRDCFVYPNNTEKTGSPYLCKSLKD